MIEQGILEEGLPIELLDGQLQWKDRSAAGEDRMTVGHEHVWVVEAISELNPKFRRHGCYARGQQPVTFLPRSEPEPDIAIVTGNRERYRQRHPSPADIVCLIGVSDSSLDRDRSRKLKIYANGGIEHYFIVNLVDRVIEAYRSPIAGRGRYAEVSTLDARQKLTIPTATGPGVTVTVKSLFP